LIGQVGSAEGLLEVVYMQVDTITGMEGGWISIGEFDIFPGDQVVVLAVIVGQ
jgi:hypothetical protein